MYLSGLKSSPILILDKEASLGIQHLQYAEVKSPTTGGIPDFDTGSLNVSNVNNGSLSYLWFKQDTNPTTVPDNTIMLELCFNIVGDPVQTACIETNKNTPTEVRWETPDGVVPVCYTFGKVNITNTPPQLDVTHQNWYWLRLQRPNSMCRCKRREFYQCVCRSNYF
ncbi:MAG: hypothetical protein IPN86_02620 [Saprospiraceae bacterium]|nr:hypothetical protein [Saprospiraceae bacterium]